MLAPAHDSTAAPRVDRDAEPPVPPSPPANFRAYPALEAADRMLRDLDALDCTADLIVIAPHRSPAIVIEISRPGQLEAWLDRQQARPHAYLRTFGDPWLQVRIADCLLLWRDTTPRSPT